jgi:predicted HicB family RNase H-like nuclease
MRTFRNLISPAISRFEGPKLSDGVAKIGGMDNYTYRAEWSPDSGEYVGMCIEFPSRYSRALTPHEAIEGVQRVIAEEVADLVACGAEPPPSITDRRYSGRFVVRTSPQLHARLMVDAAEQGVSFNQWVVQKLAERKTIPSLDDLF